MNEILLNKHYDEPSVFLPENLLREARRQKKLQVIIVQDAEFMLIGEL